MVLLPRSFPRAPQSINKSELGTCVLTLHPPRDPQKRFCHLLAITVLNNLALNEAERGTREGPAYPVSSVLAQYQKHG